MGSHHDHNDHHSNEKKPVAFTVPLIFASVIVLVIVLFVSLGDPKHGECCCAEGECSKECMEKCEAGGHKAEACCDKDGAKAAHMGHDDHAAATEHNEAEAAKDSTATEPAVDSTAKTEHKEEAHH